MPKGIQKQQTVSAYGHSGQSELPNVSQSFQGRSISASPIFTPDANKVPMPGRSQTMPPTGETKPEAPSKQSGGLFGFSVGICSLGPQLLKRKAKGCCPYLVVNNKLHLKLDLPLLKKIWMVHLQRAPRQNILTLLGGSNIQQTSPPSGSSSQTHIQGSAPPKETQGLDLFSMFSGTSTQQSSTQPDSCNQKQTPGTVPSKGKISHGFTLHDKWFWHSADFTWS